MTSSYAPSNQSRKTRPDDPLGERIAEMITLGSRTALKAAFFGELPAALQGRASWPPFLTCRSEPTVAP